MHLEPDVRDGLEEGAPVLAHLGGADERPRRMDRVGQDVVRREAVDEPVEVVRVGRGDDAVEELRRGAAAGPCVTSSIRYSGMYLIRRVLLMAGSCQRPGQARRRYDASGRRARAAQRRRGGARGAAPALPRRRVRLHDGRPRSPPTPTCHPRASTRGSGPRRACSGRCWDRALAGSAPTHAEQRSDAASVAAPDGAAIVRSWARLSAEVGALADPIHRLVEAAAHVDPEVARLHARIETGAVATDGAQRRLPRRHRPPATRRDARAGARLLLLHSTLYDRLVTDAGWTPNELVRLRRTGPDRPPPGLSRRGLLHVPVGFCPIGAERTDMEWAEG